MHLHQQPFTKQHNITCHYWFQSRQLGLENMSQIWDMQLPLLTPGHTGALYWPTRKQTDHRAVALRLAQYCQ